MMLLLVSSVLLLQHHTHLVKSLANRPQRKQVHWVFHSAAFLAALLGFLAAWKSHTLKQPPIPNLYSPHSYIGLAALLMLVGQVRQQHMLQGCYQLLTKYGALSNT
jgi:hypothetical protein